MRTFKTTRCQIRQDLIDQEAEIELTRPEKTTTIWGQGTNQYRWLGEVFQIKAFRLWWNANSIDFTFIN